MNLNFYNLDYICFSTTLWNRFLEKVKTIGFVKIPENDWGKIHLEYLSSRARYSPFCLAEWRRLYQEMIFCDEIYMKSKNEYWYYLVWTRKSPYTIEKVRENIDKFIKRKDKLGIYYLDISFEHGENKGREHYNMRIKSRKMIAKQRFKQYEKIGKIDYQSIKVKTEENFNNIGNYCNKENPIEVLILVDPRFSVNKTEEIDEC